MKSLNRFAHSADTLLAQASLEETLSLAVALTARQAAMKKTTVSVSCPPDLWIHTYLFPFESLLYLTLCRLYAGMAGESCIAVQAATDDATIIITFQPEAQTPFVIEKTPDDERALADLLGATCQSADKKLIISLPAAIDQQ